MTVLINISLNYEAKTPKEAEAECVILEKRRELNKVCPFLHLYLRILPVLFLRRKTGSKCGKGHFNLWRMTACIVRHSGFTPADDLGGREEVRSADVVKKKKKGQGVASPSLKSKSVTVQIQLDGVHPECTPRKSHSHTHPPY